MKTTEQLQSIADACLKTLAKAPKPKGKLSESLSYLMEQKTKELINGRIKDLTIEEIQKLLTMLGDDSPVEFKPGFKSTKKNNG